MRIHKRWTYWFAFYAGIIAAGVLIMLVGTAQGVGISNNHPVPPKIGVSQNHPVSPVCHK